MDRKEKREKEIEKRERLVQTFIVIGGFFVAYSGQDKGYQELNIILFTVFLYFILLYYIFITRTMDIDSSDRIAILSSMSYSALITSFIYIRGSEHNLWKSSIMFILLSGVLCFLYYRQKEATKSSDFMKGENIAKYLIW